MTKQELNRDIKRLFKAYYKDLEEANKNTGSNETFYTKQEAHKKELKRLYYADVEMEYLSLNSIKMLLRLNISLRVISLHSFGSNIEL